MHSVWVDYRKFLLQWHACGSPSAPAGKLYSLGTSPGPIKHYVFVPFNSCSEHTGNVEPLNGLGLCVPYLTMWPLLSHGHLVYTRSWEQLKLEQDVYDSTRIHMHMQVCDFSMHKWHIVWLPLQKPYLHHISVHIPNHSQYYHLQLHAHGVVLVDMVTGFSLLDHFSH